MDFLKPIYNEGLNSEGAVGIEGSVFERSRIFYELEPETYELAFAEWLEERKDRLLQKADEILAQYDNANRFEQLKRSFKSGGLRPFIGAGMLVASGYPGWTSFLYQLCDESHVRRADLDALLNTGNYEQVAQMLYDDLGSALFNENLESAFYVRNEINGPIQYLPILFPNCSILTTNFDDIIEKLYQGNGGFDGVRSGASLSEVLRNMAGGARLLIKLHGDCRIIADRVLLKSEYDQHYSDTGVIKTFFNRILFGSSFLFLGCSLSADRTIKTMAEIVTEHSADTLPRHYAFLSLNDGDDRVARKKVLASANIFPIWYFEDDHDECLESLFLALLED